MNNYTREMCLSKNQEAQTALENNDPHQAIFNLRQAIARWESLPYSERGYNVSWCKNKLTECEKHSNYDYRLEDDNCK